MNSRYRSRFLLLPVVVLACLGLLAPAASAAVPSNDLLANATPAALGFTQVLDTTGATKDADDTQVNAECGAPATDASVWYKVAGDGTGLLVDTNGSNYSVGVTVAVGTPGALELVTCGPDAVGFTTEVGTTYYVQVFDYQGDGGGNGGQLRLAFADIPPPPVLDVTVDPKGTFNNKTGSAIISGTYVCSGAAFLDVFIDARQSVGRLFVLGSGGFFEEGTCDGTPHRWTTEIFPDNGKFAGGKTLTLSVGFACGVVECSIGFNEQTVQLSGKGK